MEKASYWLLFSLHTFAFFAFFSFFIEVSSSETIPEKITPYFIRITRQFSLRTEQFLSINPASQPSVLFPRVLLVGLLRSSCCTVPHILRKCTSQRASLPRCCTRVSGVLDLQSWGVDSFGIRI